MDPTSICRKDRRLAEWQAEQRQAEPEIMAKLAWGTRLGVRAKQVYKTGGKQKMGAGMMNRKQMIWINSLPSGTLAHPEG